MNTLLVSILIGVSGYAIYEGVRLLTRRGTNAAVTGSAQQEPSRTARIQYRSYVTAFVIAPFLAAWFASSAAPSRISGLTLLFTSLVWLSLGLLPLAVVVARGRQNFKAFMASVEVQSRASFKSLVRLWLLAVIVAALLSVQKLSQ